MPKKPKVVIHVQLPAGMENPYSEEFELVPVEAGAGGEAWLSAVEQAEAQGLVVSMGRRLDADLLAKLPSSVRIVATSSVGYDHIDLAAAKKRGIVVTNTPDVLTNATADMALLLILCACRRAREYLHVMESGWGKPLGFAGLLGTDLAGKTLGIYGMGRIGRAVADRARAFGMKIAYYNRHRLKPEQEKGAVYYDSLEALLPHAEVLSVNAPATPETRHALNARTLALLPKGAVLVNVARGDLVNEGDLLAALGQGHLAGAGLDVFAAEPNFDRRLAEHPRVFLTPHAASATVETRTAIARRALENVALVLKGQAPRDPVET